MRRFIIVSFIVIGFTALAARESAACVCALSAEKPTAEQARAALVKDFNDALAVFSGEVIARDTFKVKFKLDKVWKGDFGDELVMSTGTKDEGNGMISVSSCDYTFQVGEKYLVFAYGTSVETMQAQKCTRTQPLRSAEQEMKDLDEVWPHEEKGRGTETKKPEPPRSNLRQR
jgi:hypothetical protein